jgi:DNA-directed RNA polymerase subunit M/transcription elongation factor TFIIS
MEELRTLALKNYESVVKDKLIAKKLEEDNYNYAIERQNEIKNGELEILYRQIYVKFITNYEKNKEKINEGTNFHKIPRELLDPKWEHMYKNRTDNKTIQRQKGAHKCPKCKSWYTTHTESQTRSADESMSIFVACTDCGYRFKYS